MFLSSAQLVPSLALFPLCLGLEMLSLIAESIGCVCVFGGVGELGERTERLDSRSEQVEVFERCWGAFAVSEYGWRGVNTQTERGQGCGQQAVFIFK